VHYVSVSLQKNNERFELEKQYNIDAHTKPGSRMPLKDQFKKIHAKPGSDIPLKDQFKKIN